MDPARESATWQPERRPIPVARNRDEAEHWDAQRECATSRSCNLKLLRPGGYYRTLLYRTPGAEELPASARCTHRRACVAGGPALAPAGWLTGGVRPSSAPERSVSSNLPK